MRRAARLLGAMGLVAVAMLSAGPAWAEPQAAPASSPEALFGAAIDTIRQHYDGPIDESALTTTALKAMLASLDGHSSYMTAEEYRQFDVTAKGQFAGVGVMVERTETGGKVRLRVIAPTAGGASARAGVAPGWEIRSVNDQSVQGLSLAQATALLRGDAGSTVAVTFVDDGGQERRIALAREVIRLPSVHHRRISNRDAAGDVGYIHIASFSEVGDREFADAIAALQNPASLSGLILDLRNNTGGFIDTAIGIAGRFLQPGTVIARIGSDAQSARAIRAQASNRLAQRSVPVVVLVNGGSASASEILAGALQDNRRASILGLVTFGKGVAQTIYPINSGQSGAVSVTTMRFYTPSGRSIQRVGIVPDLLVARTANDAVAAVSAAPALSEADISGAPANEMALVRFRHTQVEGPAQAKGVALDAEDPPLFRDPLPSDADILSDFQIQRALDVLRVGSVAAAQRQRPAVVYRADANAIADLGNAPTP